MLECRVQVEVTKGRNSLGLQHSPTAVKVNGVAIPNVSSVDVQYHAGDVRKVVIVLIPTDFEEVEVAAAP